MARNGNGNGKTKTSKPKSTATSTSYRYSPISKKTYDFKRQKGSSVPLKKTTDPKTGKVKYLQGFKVEYKHDRKKAGEVTKSRRTR